MAEPLSCPADHPDPRDEVTMTMHGSRTSRRGREQRPLPRRPRSRALSPPRRERGYGHSWSRRGSSRRGQAAGGACRTPRSGRAETAAPSAPTPDVIVDAEGRTRLSPPASCRWRATAARISLWQASATAGPRSADAGGAPLRALPPPPRRSDLALPVPPAARRVPAATDGPPAARRRAGTVVRGGPGRGWPGAGSGLPAVRSPTRALPPPSRPRPWEAVRRGSRLRSVETAFV